MNDVCAVPGDARVSIGETDLNEGMSCSSFSTDKEYPFEYIHDDVIVESKITFLQSGNLPSLYIDVESADMEYIHMDKTHEESGWMRIYSEKGTQLSANRLLSVKGRGNTSWGADKKPYNITLAEQSDLLGMGSAQNWVLLAEGHNEINIRNKLVFDFARSVGLDFSPESEWVNLYLNGEYAGLYLLTERNEIHKERVDISENGSFLISMENQQNMENQKIPYVALDSSQVLRVRQSDMTEQEITEIWRALKNSLLSENGCDPITGKKWTDLIDIDSWVRKYLIEEVFANPDGGAVSQYFYLNGDDSEKKIFAGPVWDYDFAMGGEDLWLWNYDAFLTMAREYTDDEMYLPWFYELYRKDLFYNRLTELYETEFLPLVNQLIEKDLDRYKNEILDSARTDGIRWGHSEKAIFADISFIGEFLENRISFLSDMWIEGTQYHIVQVNPGRYLSGYFAVKDGECLPELPAAEDLGGVGWYLADSDVPFDISQPIYEDMRLYMKQPESSLPTIHFAPLIGLIAFLTGLAAWNMYWDKKNRRQNHDTAKTA